IIFQFTNCSNKEHDVSYEGEYDYSKGENYTDGSNIDPEQSNIHTQNKFKEHNSYSIPNNQIGYEFYMNGSNYYPIGWSRDGKIAFRQFTSFDGIGGCLDEIIIQSTISDKILKTIKLDEFNPEESEDWDNHCDLDQTWNRERRTILKYLNRYEIEDNSFGLINTSTSIRTSDGEFKIKLSQSLLEEFSDETGRENSTKYKLKVYFDGDSKTISNDRITAHNVDYLGYYKSPFENRVIIVLQYQDSSYGEYSHNGGIITIGCDLDVKSWSK
ncbi:MAG: hypothetical protein ACKVJW_01755, partial [Flavobacteriales bacterium]